MRTAVLAAAIAVWSGGAFAQDVRIAGASQTRASASGWEVVECRRGAEAKRAVRHEFGRLEYVKAREVLDGPRWRGARCMSKLEYWRLGRALDLSQGTQFASAR